MIQDADKIEKKKCVLFYSNKICPYCQRVQILLEDASITHERTEVDFTANTVWLAALTPIGKIPILVDGEHVIFGSGVILEYLNESCGNRYLPQDTKERAVVRSLCTVVDQIHDDVRTYISVRTESEFDAAWKKICERLVILVEFGENLALFGDKLMMPEIYFAPLFVLLQTLSECTKDFFSPESPAARLSLRLLNTPTVISINDAHYRSRLLKFLLSADSYFASVSTYMRSELLDENGVHELTAAGYLTGAK